MRWWWVDQRASSVSPTHILLEPGLHSSAAHQQDLPAPRAVGAVGGGERAKTRVVPSQPWRMV